MKNLKATEQAELAIRHRDYKKAEALLSEQNQNPAQRSYKSLLLHGFTHEALGNPDRAIKTFENAIELADKSGEKIRLLNKVCALMQLADQLNQPEQLEQFIKHLEHSVHLDSTEENSAAIVNLCMAYESQSRFREIVPYAQNLYSMPAQRITANLMLARCYFYVNSKRLGLEHLGELEKSADSLGDTEYFMLVQMLFRYSAFDRAQTVLDRATDERKKSVYWRLYQGQVAFERTDYQSVLELFSRQVIAACSHPQVARQMSFSKARSLEELGKFDDAFNVFCSMNGIAQKNYNLPRHPDPVQVFSDMDLSAIPVYPADADITYVPVFMVAFPRSGTTLLESILDTQVDIDTLSELDGISAAVRTLKRAGMKYPDDLPQASREIIGQARQKYYEHNKIFCGDFDIAKIVIDKLPLNIVHIPFIRMLFPSARYILSLRHPLDVILSCFQQDFQLNQEMSYFLELQEAFKRYRDVMFLLQKYRSELNLEIHTVRYEDLVTNLDREAAELFRFLGYTPDENYRKFAQLNQNKVVLTPSRNQITKPMYSASMHKWRNYEKHLDPYVSMIKTLIDLFGYDAQSD